jgi:hypothetical protein
MNEGDLRKPLNSGSTANFWKRRSVAVAFVFAFIIAARDVSVYACSCQGRGDGLFIMNRESDDKTLILPRDARGVLWWQVQHARQKQSVQKANFAVRLLSGTRERNLDFRVIEVKPDLFLIAPIEKLAPGNRYVFTHQKDTQQPASAHKVEAIVENTAFAAIKDQVQLWLSSSERAELKVASDTGMCSRTVDVVAQDIHIDEPAAIERWRFALLFETVLDGKRDWWPRDHLCGNYPPGSSWRGYGSDIIFAECTSAAAKEIAGTKEGEHEVYMTISVPGTQLVAMTKKHSFRLTCTSPTLK